MAKLKVETNRDTELIKFEALQVGEVFIMKNGEACMKMLDTFAGANTVCLNDGRWMNINDDALVTYVRKAELKLII